MSPRRTYPTSTPALSSDTESLQPPSAGAVSPLTDKHLGCFKDDYVSAMGIGSFAYGFTTMTPRVCSLLARAGGKLLLVVAGGLADDA